MCKNASRFVPQLLGALSREVNLNPKLGQITSNVLLPPRLNGPEDFLIVQALLATVSCVRCNYPAVNISDEVMEAGADPASVARWLARISLELAGASGIFNRQITLDDLGSRRICFSVLLAVTHLFLSLLASIMQASETFKKRMRALKVQISQAPLLGDN